MGPAKTPAGMDYRRFPIGCCNNSIKAYTANGMDLQVQSVTIGD